MTALSPEDVTEIADRVHSRISYECKDASRFISEEDIAAVITDALAALSAKVEAHKDDPASAEYVIATAYQVVGSLAETVGLFEHPEIVRAMNYFAYDGKRTKHLLPWPRTDLASPTRAAIRREALEEAAKLVDEDATYASVEQRELSKRYLGLLAQNIRSLADKEPQA